MDQRHEKNWALRYTMVDDRQAEVCSSNCAQHVCHSQSALSTDTGEDASTSAELRRTLQRHFPRSQHNHEVRGICGPVQRLLG